jgi:hypothetical protein
MIMHAYEFNLRSSDKGELIIPGIIKEILKTRKKVRVLVLVDEDEEQAWQILAQNAFLAGYAEKDAAYDTL